MLRVSMATGRVNVRQFPEGKGRSSVRRLGRQLIGAPVPGNHKSRFGVFFSACRCGCVHCPFFLAKKNQGAFKIGHQGQDKTILQSCAFLCRCRMLHNSVRICVHPCRESDDMLAGSVLSRCPPAGHLSMNLRRLWLQDMRKCGAEAWITR